MLNCCTDRLNSDWGFERLGVAIRTLGIDPEVRTVLGLNTAS